MQGRYSSERPANSVSDENDWNQSSSSSFSSLPVENGQSSYPSHVIIGN